MRSDPKGFSEVSAPLKPPKRKRLEKTPKEGSNGVLERVEYTVPDSDLTAFLSATSAKGKEAYTDDGGDRFQFGGARGKGGGVCVDLCMFYVNS